MAVAVAAVQRKNESMSTYKCAWQFRAPVAASDPVVAISCIVHTSAGDVAESGSANGAPGGGHCEAEGDGGSHEDDGGSPIPTWRTPQRPRG